MDEPHRDAIVAPFLVFSGIVYATSGVFQTLAARAPAASRSLLPLTAWSSVAHGLLMAGATSKRKFQSCQLHVEFQLPFMPAARGQARGNSGCYLQGRYEVQMLDSFGLEGLDNECGGIYSNSKPLVNMCLPPLTWQTYDVELTGAKFDGDGNVTAPARCTMKHNGVLIHDELELKTTPAGGQRDQKPVAVYLQDHGDPVRFRNIWIAERK